MPSETASASERWRKVVFVVSKKLTSLDRFDKLEMQFQTVIRNDERKDRNLFVRCLCHSSSCSQFSQLKTKLNSKKQRKTTSCAYQLLNAFSCLATKTNSNQSFAVKTENVFRRQYFSFFFSFAFISYIFLVFFKIPIHTTIIAAFIHQNRIIPKQAKATKRKTAPSTLQRLAETGKIHWNS